MNSGKFVISLDFELYWGVRDVLPIHAYSDNLLGVHAVFPRMLEAFRKFDIHATFATVGFLFAKDKEDLLKRLPNKQPNYIDKNLSPYGNNYFDKVGEDVSKDPYHFAPNLIDLLQSFPEHEIGSHTFSHYYCLEAGQTVDEFVADLSAAKSIAQSRNIELTSLVFPRNQFNAAYLNACFSEGIICYRGNEQFFAYDAKQTEQQNLLVRAIRLLDAYINISGMHTFKLLRPTDGQPVNIPASRFLRPAGNFGWLEKMRLKRITSAMTHAAINKEVFHLWWHPHNFGINQDENLFFLEQILQHYKYLAETYDFESITMTKLAKCFLDGQ